MKKIVSFILSAAMSLSVMSSTAVKTDVSAAEKKDITIFGDSIAAGYGLESGKEYNYGEICADYLGCSVNNYAVSGDTTDDMLKVIENLSADQKKNLQDSKYVIISIGGNDMMNFASKQLLNFAVKKHLLNPGVTAADIPADPSISDLFTYINLRGEGGLVEYATKSSKNAIELSNELSKLSANLRLTTGSNAGVIPNKIIPNIDKAVSEIHAINPDAEIIVQTIYQPLQIEQSYFKGSASDYAAVVTLIREKFEAILQNYTDNLSNINGIEIADVRYQFSSLGDTTQNDQNPGHASYFTDILASDFEDKDFHPNQKGHLAIAATILDTIGILHDDTGLLTKVYKGVSDKYAYPAIALDTYKKVAGNHLLGDVNFDGSTNAKDATLVLSEYANIQSGNDVSLSEYQKTASDINKDNKYDGRDATLILMYYAYASSGNDISPNEYLSDYKKFADK